MAHWHALRLQFLRRDSSGLEHAAGGCCLVSTTSILIVNSSGRAQRPGSYCACKSTHRIRLWELTLSDAKQMMDLIYWLVDWLFPNSQLSAGYCHKAGPRAYAPTTSKTPRNCCISCVYMFTYERRLQTRPNSLLSLLLSAPETDARQLHWSTAANHVGTRRRHLFLLRVGVIEIEISEHEWCILMQGASFWY